MVEKSNLLTKTEIVEHEFEKKLQRERALRLCLEKFVPCGIVYFNLEKELQHCNSQFITMIGWSNVELIGKSSSFPFWPDGERPTLGTIFDTANKENVHSQGYELNMYRKNNSTIWVRIHMEPILMEEKQDGWLMLVTDLSNEMMHRNRLAAMICQMNSRC